MCLSKGNFERGAAMAIRCKCADGDAEQGAVRTEAGFGVRCSISRGGMTHVPEIYNASLRYDP